MHCIQLIAVTLDHAFLTEDNEENYARAMARVESARDSNSFADWSDWSDVGGGRWSSQFRTVNGKADITDFKHYLDQSKKWRAESIDELLGKIDYKFIVKGAKAYADKLRGKNVQPLDIVDRLTQGMDGYYAFKLANIINGDHSPDSAFFDLETWSSDYKFVEERLNVEPQYQFLVPVDFHY